MVADGRRWSQALQQVETLCTGTVNSSQSIENMQSQLAIDLICCFIAKNDDAKLIQFPFRKTTNPLPKHTLVCCVVEK